MSEPVIHGDKYPIPFSINGPLTGDPETKVIAVRGATKIEIPHEVLEPENPASGNLLDTSMLSLGGHSIALVAVWGDGTRVTYPLTEPLMVDDVG